MNTFFLEFCVEATIFLSQKMMKKKISWKRQCVRCNKEYITDKKYSDICEKCYSYNYTKR